MTHEHVQHTDAEKQAIQQNIDEHGCHLALLEADNYLPAFAYTIGLFQKFGHPELIVFGLPAEVMGHLLNAAADRIANGEKLAAGKPVAGFLEGFDIRFLEADEAYYADYVGYGGWFYGHFDFPLLQLVWPDKQSRFPWENDFNPDWKFKQPLLDRNTDFKFYEERNLGVYTTRQFLEGAPIVHVYHDNDGDWQFHTGEDTGEDDIKIVALEEIVKKDPSINELFSLQFGWRAWRDSAGDEWQTAGDEEENGEV